jgi:RimJ/RimL family protein N-acetyltransferase
VRRKSKSDMTQEISLAPIDPDGTPRGYEGPIPGIAIGPLEATARLYESAGFEEPWIGYLALCGSTPVGTCGFKSPPRDNRVEIAYFTFPEFEGRGFATAMARRLAGIARRHRSSVLVAAQTLPGRNASHVILERLGFRHVATLDHPEDGEVWEWRLDVNG